MGYFIYTCWPRCGPLDLQKLQATAIALGYSLQTDSKSLLLRISPNFIIKIEKSSWKLYFLLVFIMLEGLGKLLEENSNHQSYPVLNPVSYSRHTHGGGIMYEHRKVTNYFLTGF